MSMVPILCLALAAGDRSDPHANRISALERAAGWRLLFDGETTHGWRSAGGKEFPAAGWEVADGCLHRIPGVQGGDIVTGRTYLDFELEFEWKIAAAGNSGVKYRVRETPGAAAMRGYEYQILDPATPGGEGRHHTAALYDLVEPKDAPPGAAGEFQRARILVQDGRIEHWWNGVRVVACDTGSDDFQQRLGRSKFEGEPDFGAAPGPIGLQDHGAEVWFRSLKIRDLAELAEEARSLIEDPTLGDWELYGDARYSVQGDAILGEVTKGAQSFLISGPTYGDFVFDVDVKTELPGNSGIQVRSHRNARGTYYGYQIEIDPSERAWSGGLYDEGRRLWLQNLENNPQGRQAYVHGEWNRYQIQCVGPWIQVRVNGVETVNYFDPLDLEGTLGLQVHSGHNTRVLWRRPRLVDLGRRAFETQDLLSFELRQGTRVEADSARFKPENGRILLQDRSRREDFVVRLRLRPSRAEVRLGARLQDPTAVGGDGLDSRGAWIRFPPGEGEGDTEITLSADGPRLVAHRDGQLLQDTRERTLPVRGALVLEATQPLEVVEVAFLSSAR